MQHANWFVRDWHVNRKNDGIWKIDYKKMVGDYLES
jgi:hypothetical protein